MKQVVAVFMSAYLLLGSVIPGNSFFELSSLLPLVKHYQYHKTTEPGNISFLSFLKLHYSNSKHQKSDPANHSNLPLQHHGNSVPFDEIVNLFSPGIIFTDNFSSGFLSVPAQSRLPDNRFASGIFHPPSVLC
jgi:hypothetical protein